MKIIKWITLMVMCVALGAALSALGVFFAVDRSFGNTDFITRIIQRQDLTALAAPATHSESSSGALSQIPGLGKLGFAMFEPEIKKQTKPMLDQLYSYLKGKTTEPQMAFSLSQLKQDPQFLDTTVQTLMRNDTMKNLPKILVEPAAKLMIEKIPAQLDLLKILRVNTVLLDLVRGAFGKFYSYYQISIWLCLFMAAAIIFLFRDKRQIALAFGITLLVAAVVLYIPYFRSEAITAKLFSSYRGVGAETVRAIGASLMKEFFAVFVLSPVILSLSGLTATALGMFVFTKKA